MRRCRPATIDRFPRSPGGPAGRNSIPLVGYPEEGAVPLIWNFHVSVPTLSTRQTREKVVCKPEKRRKAVLDFVRSAKRSLLLSVFRCDDIEVLYELGEAIARGVDVHALITG